MHKSLETVSSPSTRSGRPRGRSILILLVLGVLAAAAWSSVAAAGVKPLSIVKVPPNMICGDPNCSGGYPSCWSAGGRFGEDTWTGSYWENWSASWCGNYYRVTSADFHNWQSVSGWYSAGGDTSWQSGGCIGCGQVTYFVTGNFAWRPPLAPYVTHTTANYVTLTASGGAYS